MKLLIDRLTPHFRLTEFACDGEMILTPEFLEFVDVLEAFRTWYARPININSGYRTAAKNKAVGGIASSLHLRAMAVDFNLPDDYLTAEKKRQHQFRENVRSKWNALCRASAGYGQIVWYSSYIHLGMSWQNEYFEIRG